MPVVSYKMGPGTLTIGAGPLDVSAQVAACRVNPSENVETSDAVPVLSGDELAAEDTVTYTYELAVTFVQDITAAGVVDYTWINKGTEQPFTFVPNTVSAREVTGVIRIIPLSIGGDPKVRNTSEVTFRIIGEPDFDAVV